MKTQVPENLSELDGDALEALEHELEAEFSDLYEDDESPLEDLTAVRDAITSVRQAQTEAAERQAEDDARRSALRDDVLGVEDAADDSDAEDGDEAEASDDADEADTEADATDDQADEPVETPAEAETEDEVADDRELVAASAGGKRGRPAPTRRRPASAAPRPAEKSSPLVITAAADVPGMSNGQPIDRMGVARAFHARARNLADSKGLRTPFNVASVAVPIPDHLVAGAGVSDLGDLMDAAVAEQLRGKDAAALVASGGWCAPSEVIYETFSVESRDGLIDLPMVGVTRGGVMYPSYIGLEGVTGGLWTWTEANDESPGSDGDATKPCLHIPCAMWNDCRQTAEGLCVTAGNLQSRADPEGTARFVDLVMTAHMHRLSNAKVASIVAGSEAVTVTSIESDAAGDILNAIDLQVADYRSEHLMSENVVLDGYFPQWFIEAIRATLAARGGVNLLSVSNAQVREFFTDRNVRPQFLAGYEPLFDTAPATDWPSTGKFVLAATGGYVVADGGSIDLGVMRDSTLNETNDFTAAWSEQFYCVMQRGPAAREVTVTVDVDGVTACCPTV